jgi:tetratricopeptide (TPR) repeat protein
VVSAVSAIGLLLLAVFGLTVSNIRVAREKELTKLQRDEAEANFRKACQAVDDQFTLVSQNKLLEAPGLQYLRKNLLESALDYYQEFLRKRPDDPVLQIEVAAAYFRLYLIYNSIGGMGTNAIGALAKGLEIVEKLLREQPYDAKLYRRLAGFAKNSRDLHSVRGPIADPQAALAVFERATRIWEHFVQVFPTELGFELDLSEFYVYTHQSQQDVFQTADALVSLRKAHALNENLARDDPKVPEYRVALAFTHQHLGERLLDDGPPEEVEMHYRRYLELSQKLEDESPKVPLYRAMVADGHHNFGRWLIASDRLPEAEQAWRKALILLQKLVTDFPYTPGYQGELATYQYRMGILLRDSGRPDEAEEAYRQAVAIWNKLAEDFPAWPEYRGEGRAFASFDLCLLLAASGRAVLSQCPGIQARGAPCPEPAGLAAGQLPGPRVPRSD